MCRTRWVERINALQIAIDMFEAIIDTLMDMTNPINVAQWNRETRSQASTLLKRLDFEFLINLFVTQKILAFTSGITVTLQKRGMDLFEASTQVTIVIQSLMHVRSNMDTFFHDWFEQTVTLATKVDIEVSAQLMVYISNKHFLH